MAKIYQFDPFRQGEASSGKAARRKPTNLQRKLHREAVAAVKLCLDNANGDMRVNAYGEVLRLMRRIQQVGLQA